jgi:hypothetical protein
MTEIGWRGFGIVSVIACRSRCYPRPCDENNLNDLLSINNEWLVSSPCNRPRRAPHISQITNQRAVKPLTTESGQITSQTDAILCTGCDKTIWCNLPWESNRKTPSGRLITANLLTGDFQSTIRCGTETDEVSPRTLLSRKEADPV